MSAPGAGGPESPVLEALLPLALLPLAALVVHLVLRSRRPRGSPPLRFDDFLGEGLLADLVRQCLRKHSDLIAANLPGPVGRFTLAVLDRPVRKIRSPPKGAQQLAVTFLYPWFRGRAFVRARGMPLQPVVCIVRSTWAPHVPRNPVRRGLERLMTETLYHEFCHLYGYRHSSLMDRLSERFLRQLEACLAGPAPVPPPS